MTVDKALKSQLKFESSAELNELNPSRLTLARKRRGLTKLALAEKLRVDRKSVQAYEAGNTIPSDETMARIVSVLGFPREFFVADDLDVPDQDSGSFRSMSKMKAPQRDMALSQVALCLDLNSWLTKKFELPKPQLPDLSREPNPEAAAEFVRRDWSLGALSIRNLIHLLEAKGVRVFSLAVDAREVDAFSMWHGGTPFVFLNTNKTSEHSRFDAAHELGHLVLHKHGPPRGLEAERQADAFSSAFLMPRGSVFANALRFPTFEGLVARKKIWTTSVGALAYRMRELELISDWQYRGICIEIAKRGKGFEPNEAPRETSMILPKLFSSLHDDGLSRAQIAAELNIPVSELEQLLFGLIMTGLDGGRKVSNENKQMPPARLRLVAKN
jgi:Zn-dependent peptidase ImmA (M78 family)/transcriptional regulator with XRE-family HTH domain